MDSLEVVEKIKKKFSLTGSPALVPLLRGSRMFTAELTDVGVNVDNLGSQSFLPWVVFQEAVCVLVHSGGKARRGDAMNFKLGETGLPLDSIEGHIARVVYGKREGDTVFRRITPIACILIWTGVCKAEPGELVLVSD